jgi:outer membrane receptor protein involved in Fe transport
VQNALLVNPVTGKCVTDAGTCVPLDVFHGIGAFTPDMENYVYEHGQRTGHTEERVVTGAITGNLGQYGVQSPWANEGVGVAIGAEYRDEYLEEITSTADYSGDLFGAGGKALGQPLAGFKVMEGFGELRIPVVHDKEFFEDLSLNAGFRYSSYSSAGVARSYKYGAEWQPIDDFRLRASFQRAVRAPNVLDLFSPQNVVLGSFSDPCAGAHPTASAAGCLASGVTASEYGHILQCPANQCNYLSGGNPLLKPESSDTRSLGLVITPTFISGFSLTIDYFDISVNKYISSVAPTVSIAGCTNLTNTSLCSLVHRGSSGTLLTTDGYVISTNINTGYLKTSGVDFEANYTNELSDWGLGENGSLAVNFIGTYVSDYLVQPYTGANNNGHTYYNCVGLYGITCGTPTPSWRHKMRVTWSSPWDVDLSVAWRHMSGGMFDGNSSNPWLSQAYVVAKTGGGEIAAYDYIDLAGNWMVTDGVQLSLGVNNLFDKDPPLLASGGKTVGPTLNLNGNTFDGIYDSLGRYLFVSITLKS